MSEAGTGAVGARAPRRYDERRLRCLGAMGLTAWVSRTTPSPVAPSAGAGAVAAAVGPAPDVVTTSAPAPVASSEAGAPRAPTRVEPPGAPVPASAPSPVAPADSVPSAPSAPSARIALSARRVEAFERRGASVFETNPGAGRALVAVERGDGAGQAPGPGRSPLAGEPAELLRLMLRAIDLAPADVSLCALGPAGAAVPDASPGAAGAAGVAGAAGAGVAGAAPALRELLGGPRRTVLWLVHDTDGAGPVDVGADAALRALGVAAFRVPHPALLLERPAAKREAWAALKAVRRRMREAAPGSVPDPGRGAASGAPAGAGR